MVTKREVAVLLRSRRERDLVAARLKINSLINHVVGKRKLSDTDLNQFKRDIVDALEAVK